MPSDTTSVHSLISRRSWKLQNKLLSLLHNVRFWVEVSFHGTTAFTSFRMPVKSRYVLLLEGLSSVTRSSDIKHEFEACGTVKEVERDAKSRSALIEMKRSSDAEYAWKKMDGLRIDCKKWKVEYAIREDFKYFGWKWTEGGDSPTPSPPRSPARSDRSD